MTADNSKTECWFVHHRSRNTSMQLLGNAIYVGDRLVAIGKCRRALNSRGPVSSRSCSGVGIGTPWAR